VAAIFENNMKTSHRPIIFSNDGLVVSGHHRASEAGAAVLRAGGNAMDAALAASAALCVALPHMNGLGGDCIGLYYDAARREVTAINGSGAAPAQATVEHLRAAGLTSIPPRGVWPVSVCGLVRAWQDCFDRFGSGRVTFDQLLEDGIALAQQGGEVDVSLRDYFHSEDYAARVAESPLLARWYGQPATQTVGQRLPQPLLATTMAQIAAYGAEVFYSGDIARRLVEDLQAQGCLLQRSDLEAHRTRFEPAPSVPFQGRRLHVAPPNSQGVALAMLAGLWQVLHERGEAEQVLDAALYMRIKSLAFQIRDHYAIDGARNVADGSPDLAQWLGDEGLCRLLDMPGNVLDFEARSGGGDTSTLVVIDKWGNAVSWVQSLFEDFGSGVVSPSTGLVMHNRLYLETLDEDPRHGLRPGIRPFHTLCPALLVGEQCEMAIASPGDHGQPQSIFQVLLNVYVQGMDLQAAVEAPRVRHDTGTQVMLESRLPQVWSDAVQALGLTPRDVGPWSRLMGGVNAIQRHPEGVLMSGADPRRSCYAVAA
jgi:gamma-glutamyltranspeptidase